MAKIVDSSEKSASMTDCRGNAVNVGDSVVYIKKTYCTACLGVGSVSAIKSSFGRMTAFIDGGYHGVTSQSIYKIG